MTVDFDGTGQASGTVAWLPWAGSDTSGFIGRGLAADISAGGHLGMSRFVPVPGAPTEAWFRYMLRLDDWLPSQSGKLPGFAGLESASARGCIPPSASRPGWSARMMYHEAGTQGAAEGMVRIGYYVYHLDQPAACGETMNWSVDLAQGSWYCIEGRIRLNDPGEANGELTGWVDGAERFQGDGLRFRSGAGNPVEDLWLNVYAGGKKPAGEDLRLTIDEVAVSSLSRIGCPDAFADDEADPNESALNHLFELGAIQPCADRQACPDLPISRGEFAGSLAATLRLPPGGDAFRDDDGTSFEAAIDSLTAAGVVSGCGGDRFCPDRPLSRGEAAVILQRAFELPVPRSSPFHDTTGGIDDAAAALVASDIAHGCDMASFCPDQPVSRSQGAVLLSRAVSQERLVQVAPEAPPRPDRGVVGPTRPVGR